MTLSFSQQWPKYMPDHMAGQNTLFPLKVLECIEENYPAEMHAFKMKSFFNYSRFRGYDSPEAEELNPKLHTIREDKSDRWKPGTQIHFVINNRSKNRYQFAPVLECKGIQIIEIFHDLGHAEIHIDGQFYGEVYRHGLDDIYQHTDDLELLAKNDGFLSVDQFFAWFKKDFTGKIIHWTGLKY